jgi:hypothetical protein
MPPTSIAGGGFLTKMPQKDGWRCCCGSGQGTAFRHWYNVIRPHQHLHGLTPHEAWCGIDPYRSAPRAVERFSAWGGLLTGFYLHR